MVVLSYIVIYKEYSFSTVHQFDRSAAKQNAELKLKKDLALVSHFVSRKSSSSDSAAFQNDFKQAHQPTSNIKVLSIVTR